MKFVYVLVGSSDDYYAEQAYLSLVSLKKHNPEAHVVLVSDEATRNNLTASGSPLNEILNDWIVAQVSTELNRKCRSRFLKVSLRRLVEGDFLYIDCDTVINGTLDFREGYDGDMYAAYDFNGSGESSEYMAEIFNKIGEKDVSPYVFYNAGVLLVKDTPLCHNFFKDWENIWFRYYQTHGLEIDQLSFVKANLKNGNFIEALPAEYNCQISFSNAIDSLLKSKILHYIADFKVSQEFPFENIKLLQKVRERGLTEEIKDILDRPIENFLKCNPMMGRGERELYRSPVMVMAKKISINYPFSNKLVRRIYKLFGYNL